jgi:hypothetical protein
LKISFEDITVKNFVLTREPSWQGEECFHVDWKFGKHLEIIDNIGLNGVKVLRAVLEDQT